MAQNGFDWRKYRSVDHASTSAARTVNPNAGPVYSYKFTEDAIGKALPSDAGGGWGGHVVTAEDVARANSLKESNERIYGGGAKSPPVPSPTASTDPAAQLNRAVPNVKGPSTSMLNLNGLGRRRPASTPDISVRPEGRREAAPTVGGVPATGGNIPGVSGRMERLLASDSPYLERARTRGLQFANRRGLANSSIAAGATEGAAIEAALPIATADAEIAARERAMRSQEFQQYRAIRSQELMQKRGINHESAMREADRELQDLMHRRGLYVQHLMQSERLDHDSAQRLADRELQKALQAADHAWRTGERLGSQEFRGTQAGLDRELTQQQIEQQARQADERLQAAVNESRQNAINRIQERYNQQRLQVQQNPDLSPEERDQILSDMARLRDESMRVVQTAGDYTVTWTSDFPPPETEEEG